MITEKQEAFVRQLLEGKTQAQAYRNAYDAAGMSRQTVYREASRLARSEAVRNRLQQLRVAREDTAVANVRERLELLTQILREERPAADKLKAVDLMNKMTGAYTQKPEPEENVTVVVELTGRSS